MPTAAYANADSTDVALTRDDGTVVAVKPDDPRLEGIEIAPYKAPPPPPLPSLEELMRQMQALQAQLAAAMAAQQG